MSLYRAETRRLLKRRFVRYLCLAGLLILAAVAVGTFFTNQQVGPAQLAAAQQQAEQEYQVSVQSTEQFRAQCEQAETAGTARPGEYPENCADIIGPTRDQINPQWFLPPTFQFREEFPQTLITFAAILALVAFVAGASFVGAEWSSGGMMNLLLWRPRRVPVLLTKLTAFLVGMFTVAVLAGAAWTAAFWLTGRFRGTTAGMTPGAWQSFGLTGLRAVVLILVAGAVGFALASIGRHTAMALGVALGIGVVVQFAVGVVLGLAQVRFIEAYLLPTYAIAWMQQKYTVQDYSTCVASPTGSCEPATLDLTWQMSGGLMAAGLILSVGAALWTMRRRDIT